MSSGNSPESGRGRNDDPVITFLGSALRQGSPNLAGDQIQPEARTMAESLGPEQFDELRAAIAQRAAEEGKSVTSGYISNLISPYYQGASAAMARGDRDTAVRTLAAGEALSILGQQQYEAERSAAMQQMEREHAAYHSRLG